MINNSIIMLIFFSSPAAVLDIGEWLKHLGLESEGYLERFRAEGINTVRDLKSREFTDELLDSLEIMIPGHRKRVKWSGNFKPILLCYFNYSLTHRIGSVLNSGL